MNFSQWLINEGVWDWESTIITRAALRAIKDNMDVFSKPRTDNYMVLAYGYAGKNRVDLTPYIKQISGKNNLKQLPPLSFTVETLEGKSSKVTSGSFDQQETSIGLHILINPEKPFTADFISQLVGKIRHELEHHDQELKGGKKVWKDYQPSKYDYEAYFNQPTEIPAHVVGANKSANYLKQPVDDVVNRYMSPLLTRNDLVGMDDVVTKTKNNWLDYHNKRYGVTKNIK